MKKGIDDYSGWFRTDFAAGSLGVASLGGMWSVGLDDQGNENGVTAQYGFVGFGLTANLGVDAGESHTKYELQTMLINGLRFTGAMRAQFAEKFAEDLRTTAFLAGAQTLSVATTLINLWGSYDWQ